MGRAKLEKEIDPEVSNARMLHSMENRRMISSSDRQTIKKAINDESTSSLGGNSSEFSDDDETVDKDAVKASLNDFGKWIHGNDEQESGQRKSKINKSVADFEEKLKKRELLLSKSQENYEIQDKSKRKKKRSRTPKPHNEEKIIKEPEREKKKTLEVKKSKKKS